MTDPNDGSERPAAPLAVAGTRTQVLVTSLSLFNFGYNTASISGVLLYIDSESKTWDCTSESICLTSSFAKGCVVSSCQLGAVLGAFAAGSLADWIGRRATLLVNNIFYTLGPIGMLLAPSVELLVLARLLTGIGVGIASALVHVYISEVVPAEERGKHGAVLVMMGTGGILVATLMSYFLSHRWRFVLGASAVSALLQAALGPCLMPQSVGNQQAREVALRSGGAFESHDGNGWAGLWRAVQQGSVRKAFIVGIGLQVLQQISGINVAIYYAPTIFKLALFPDGMSIILSASVSGVQMVATLFLSILVDKVGRKPMCFIGLVLMAFSLVILGLAFLHFLISGKAAGWLAFVGMVAYRMAFSISLGPLPFIITAEIFPATCRAKGAAVCWAANWAANFVVSQTFPLMLSAVKPSGTFFFYAAICVAAVWFVWARVPETSCRTLEDLQDASEANNSSRIAQVAIVEQSEAMHSQQVSRERLL